MTGNLVDINGHKLYFKLEGTGTGYPVVFLHHGLGAVYSWSEQIPVLAEAGYHVIAYDRWGYGNSEPREQLNVPYFEEDLSDLDQLLNYLEIKKAALVGHSDGGTIALYYAAKHPQRVSCLVTIAPIFMSTPKCRMGLMHCWRAIKIRNASRMVCAGHTGMALIG
jgi:pimeloyl-ACP methyl ester carboxylesterase